MTQHDDDIRLRHMLDHAREARSMVQGKHRADLQRDRMLELALVRLIEVVGEAAARVSPEGCKKYSRIPWAEITGMRNRLVHGVDYNDRLARFGGAISTDRGWCVGVIDKRFCGFERILIREN